MNQTQKFVLGSASTSERGCTGVVLLSLMRFPDAAPILNQGHPDVWAHGVLPIGRDITWFRYSTAMTSKREFFDNFVTVLHRSSCSSPFVTIRHRSLSCLASCGAGRLGIRASWNLDMCWQFLACLILLLESTQCRRRQSVRAVLDAGDRQLSGLYAGHTPGRRNLQEQKPTSCTTAMPTLDQRGAVQ